MSIFINSPVYFSETHGIENGVYKMCRLLEKNIDVKLYTSILDTIGITPIIAPNEEIKSGKYKEVRLVSLSYRFADISLHIDYSNYLCANFTERKKMIVNNILTSLFVIKKRLKDDFEYTKIENDILTLLNEKL